MQSKSNYCNSFQNTIQQNLKSMDFLQIKDFKNLSYVLIWPNQLQQTEIWNNIRVVSCNITSKTLMYTQ